MVLSIRTTVQWQSSVLTVFFSFSEMLERHSGRIMRFNLRVEHFSLSSMSVCDGLNLLIARHRLPLYLLMIVLQTKCGLLPQLRGRLWMRMLATTQPPQQREFRQTMQQMATRSGPLWIVRFPHSFPLTYLTTVLKNRALWGWLCIMCNGLRRLALQCSYSKGALSICHEQ